MEMIMLAGSMLGATSVGGTLLAGTAALGGAAAAASGGLSKGPSMPTLPAGSRAPTIDDAAASRAAEDESRRRRGRAATQLTGQLGAGTPETAAKTLLGG